MAHVLKNGWQEGAETIQKDVLAKLNGTTIILVSIYPSHSGRATHLTYIFGSVKAILISSQLNFSLPL
jgi:hypothetical protein